MDNLTAVIAVKDRPLNINYCVNSILGCTPSPKIVIVDFGSVKPVINIVPRSDRLEVIAVSRDVRIFHKARALNIGIRKAETEFVCITDADQVFDKKFFGQSYISLNE